LDVRKILSRASENWPAKVLSIAVAIVIFVFHRMSTLEHRFFSIPLQTELEPSIAPASVYPRMIRVSVRGESVLIHSLSEEDIEPYVDLKGKGKGTYRARVQFRKKGNALGIEPLEIKVEPVEISLTLDNRISKLVNLKTVMRGSVRQGYELVSYSTRPAQVILDGPVELISAISEISTEIVEMEGRTDDFSMMLPILNDNFLINIRGSTMVEFRASIKPIVGLGSLTALPIRIYNLDERFVAELDVRTASIRFSGSQIEIENYVPNDGLLFVDLSGITQTGTYSLPVIANLDPDFTLIRQDPEIRSRE